MPEQKPRTALPFILHQADLMAARIEFEKEWLPKLKNNQKEEKPKKTSFVLDSNSKKSASKQTKALGSIKSNSLKNMLDDL
jgi:hypothetical protein